MYKFGKFSSAMASSPHCTSDWQRTRRDFYGRFIDEIFRDSYCQFAGQLSRRDVVTRACNCNSIVAVYPNDVIGFDTSMCFRQVSLG